MEAVDTYLEQEEEAEKHAACIDCPFQGIACDTCKLTEEQPEDDTDELPF